MSEMVPFLTNLTPAGLLGLGVVMMMFGWLVPVRMVRTMLSSKDRIIEEQARHIATQSRTLEAVLRGNVATEAVVSATADVMHRGGGSDGAGAVAG